MSSRIGADCAWSDYRKDYGVSADEHTRMLEHKAFHAGWDAALEPDREQGLYRVAINDNTVEKVAVALSRQDGYQWAFAKDLPGYGEGTRNRYRRIARAVLAALTGSES